jgi:4Fe-4S single cluster domain
VTTDEGSDQKAALAAISRAYDAVHTGSGSYRFTDLRKTRLEDVQSRFFRLFVPVRHDRLRLPTSLPEFSDLRHRATLSDSPVTAAAELGGHWSEHNVAAITHIGACNFRCSYCYVDYRHLAGKDALSATAAEVVDDFLAIRTRLEAEGRRLTILRLSGGEPLLAPGLITELYAELRARDLLEQCVVKLESNLSALPYAVSRLPEPALTALRDAAPHVTLHATLHAKPGERDWSLIEEGLSFALDLGMNLYPAIGGIDWDMNDMKTLFDVMSGISPGLVHRLAVRPFNVAYAERYGRRAGLKAPADRPASLSASAAWEGLLLERTGERYLARPRHEIGLCRG